jgi:hypothetical protein
MHSLGDAAIYVVTSLVVIVAPLSMERFPPTGCACARARVEKMSKKID